MGDVARGIAYLCCFCCKDSDAIQDGSRISTKTKPDPREREIDEFFMSRNYQKDANGRFHTQPTPTPSMLPNRSRSNSKISTHPQSEIKSINQSYGDRLEVVVPALMVADSGSSDATTERPKETEEGESNLVKYHSCDMDKLLHRLKASIHPSNGADDHDGTKPQHQFNINRNHFRKQRGVNLGSWFVLERWITESPFQEAHHPAQSDLDVALGRNAKSILEHHWDTWIQRQDWDWIAERGINSVRIPIGYYHLCGADRSVLHGTDFEPHHHIYEGAWSRITAAIDEASQRSLGVLIDLHAAPGKQNHDAHAGTSGPANFFGDIYNRTKTTQVLLVLVNALNRFTTSQHPPLRNIIGIELINEPDANPVHDQILKDWYAHTIHLIRQVDHTMPLYIGECWRPDSYPHFISTLASTSKSGPIILDHHLYRCFTSSDIHTPVQYHIKQLKNTTAPSFSRLSQDLGRSGSGLVVGEWSGGLNEGSSTGTRRDERRAFVDAQLQLFEENTGGWFFWTFKKEDDEDGAWSMRGAVAKGMFPEFVGFRRDEEKLHEFQTRSEEARSRTLGDAYRHHVEYWAKIPGRYQHAFFEQGFLRGWDEAAGFITSTATSAKTIDQIGFKGALAGFTPPAEGEECKSYWEYEHGYIQGATSAEGEYMTLCTYVV